jgi:hypothetical protein
VVVSIAFSFIALAMLIALTTHELSLEAADLAEQRRLNLPTCEWRIRPGQEFSCFLSHYKVEAGAEARYLKDSLDKMLHCPAYLDSSTLADLRSLLSTGVAKSEVLIIMLSKGLLTRSARHVSDSIAMCL